MLQENEFIVRAVVLVRRGDFIGAASDDSLIRNLEAVCRTNPPTTDYEWLRSCALLSEILDQIGEYKRAADIFAKPGKFEAVFLSLRRAGDEGKCSGPISNDERRLLRAEALYILQAAIHKLRRFKLGAASKIMAECQKILNEISSKREVRFHSVLSLFHYWQGRVELARNELPKALEHFQKSMRQTEKNLDFHYSGSGLDVRADHERITYATYALSSCMAFGVAHTHHISGQLKQALDLLRPASAMLMGTGDNYRRGYAMMLIGAAERALAGPDEARLNAAIAILEESLRLFGHRSGQIQHHLHQARVHHQLAIAYVYLAQAHREQNEKGSSLRAASHHTTVAQAVLTKFTDDLFEDKELRYDLLITRSRILREQKEYDESFTAATNALDVARDCPYHPDSSEAKALVARAETRLAQYDDQKKDSQFLTEAEADLKEARKTCDNNLAMATVTRLYQSKILLMRGEIDQARWKFRDAWDSRDGLIQNGWVRELARKIQEELGHPDTEYTVNFNQLAEELDNAKKTGQSCETLWDTVTKRFQKAMIKWAQRTSPHHPWDLLGIARATYYDHCGQRPRRTTEL